MEKTFEIVRNIGHTVNFQTTKKSFKNKKQVRLPKDQWVICENTQEPIIDGKTFETVQQMRKTKRAYAKFNELDMFSGLLLYLSQKKGLCTSHRILVSRLEQIVVQKFQDMKIVYNLVGVIDLPQYAI